MIAETFNRFSGRYIQGIEPTVIGGEKDAPLAVAALPIGDASAIKRIGEVDLHVVGQMRIKAPNFLSRAWVQGADFLEGGTDQQLAFVQDRRVFEGGHVHGRGMAGQRAGGIAPRLMQLADIGGGDLAGAGVALPALVAAILRPAAVGQGRRREHHPTRHKSVQSPFHHLLPIRYRPAMSSSHPDAPAAKGFGAGPRRIGDVWQRLGLNGGVSGTDSRSWQGFRYAYLMAALIVGVINTLNVMSITHDRPHLNPLEPLIWEG